MSSPIRLTAQRRAVCAALPLLLLAACTDLGAQAVGRVGLLCSVTAQCGFKESCVSGVCAPDFCSSNAECGSENLVCCGTRCIAAGSNCNAGCVTDADCGRGVCALGRCVTVCDAQGRCAAGETCVPVLNVCLPNFAADQDVDLDIDLADGPDLPFDLPGDLPFDIPGDLPFDLPDVPTPQCTTSADCRNGDCVFGFCVDLGGPGGGRCSTDTDCGTSQRCVAGVCIGRPADGPCTGPQDCGGGFCVPGAGVCVGGTPRGTGRCERPADCRPDEECVFGLCLPLVGGDGESVTETADGRTRCTNNADCPQGERCAFGFCFAAPDVDFGADGPEFPEGRDRDRDRGDLTEAIDASPSCVTDTDCGAGRICFQGVCLTP